MHSSLSTVSWQAHSQPRNRTKRQNRTVLGVLPDRNLTSASVRRRLARASHAVCPRRRWTWTSRTDFIDDDQDLLQSTWCIYFFSILASHAAFALASTSADETRTGSSLGTAALGTTLPLPHLARSWSILLSQEAL